MARKLKITENEKYTLQDVKYGQENKKRQRIQKCPLQDMEYGKETKIIENEEHPFDLKNDITKNVKKEKCTLQDLEYGEKTENNRK